MRTFAKLFDELDSTTSTNEKIDALKIYFKISNAEDSMWAILLLTGRISRRILTSKKLRDLFTLSTQYPVWLFEECHHQVGDTAETLSLLAQTLELCQRTQKLREDFSLTIWMEERIPRLGKIKDEKEQADLLISWWKNLTTQEVFIVNKLMTGGFRVGVSEKIVIRALAEVHNLPTDQVAHRMTGKNSPGAQAFADLISQEKTEVTFSQPYPFCLAHAWSGRTELGFETKNWCIEWKFDGIRSQVIRRESDLWIWSRGEEDITKTFPDIKEALTSLPNGCVLDGEILVILDGKIKPFQELQKRLGRKKLSTTVLKEQPAGFIAYDCLEFQGQDLRQKTLRERRKILEEIMLPLMKDPSSKIRISESLKVKDLQDVEALRADSRNHQAEGLMIKAWESPYSVGRKTGDWWKHKVDPLTLDAVLIYAQSGSGRRANLYTDYTFALWNEAASPKAGDQVAEKKLVPFAKAYSGLDQKEIDELDSWIRKNTKEKFGPVRSVEPQHVFEIAFEGIGPSPRHKSGIAVRFPRILRWRRDKKPEDADTLSSAQELIGAQ